MTNEPTTAELWTGVREGLRLARNHEASAQTYYSEVGSQLALLKDRKPAGVTWPDWVRAEADLSRERADELIRIAKGDMTVEDVRKRARESTAKSKRKPGDTVTGLPKRRIIDLGPEPLPPDDPAEEARIDAKSLYAAYMIRGEHARRMAVYSGPVTDKNRPIVVAMARGAAEAWTLLADELEKRP